jgi:D-glycero-alpha-D-manno-heptose-7-phosphate kinase
MADLPGRTGLGSSGSFTTALLKALSIHNNESISTHSLAEMACEIEINILQEPIGKQDQYISAYGGINAFTFKQDKTVTTEPLQIAKSTVRDLEDNLLLFYTGQNRSAGEILKDQDQKSQIDDKDMISNLHVIKNIGKQSRDSLINGDLTEFAELMNTHWENKRLRSNSITNSKIDKAYVLAIANGAIGGKLVGAGGGGFLMFYARDAEKLRGKMKDLQMPEVQFKFDFEGTSAVLH